MKHEEAADHLLAEVQQPGFAQALQVDLTSLMSTVSSWASYSTVFSPCRQQFHLLLSHGVEDGFAGTGHLFVERLRGAQLLFQRISE